MSRTSEGIRYHIYFLKNVRVRRKYQLRWYPDKSSKRIRYKAFSTRTQAEEYTQQGFPNPDERIVKIGRKPNSVDEENQNNPETWPDELSEVMAKVTEIRTKSYRPFSLLSDVYRAMKELGFKR